MSHRHLAAGTMLLLSWLATTPPSHADWPQWMDRWLFNAEERTQRGQQSLESKDFSQAAASMDTAMRLAPEDATAKFNAGTARLPLAPEEGRKLLEAAGSQAQDRELKSLAHYNAGSSLLEAGEFQPAIDAFKNALREQPNFEDAKFNLELAQKRLKEQQEQQQNQDGENQDPQDQEQQDQEQQQDQQNQDQEQQDEQNQDPQDQEQQDQEQQQDQQNQDQEQQDQEQQNQEQQGQDPQDQEQQQNQEQQQDQQGQQNPESQEGPLPEFKDLPDMTAEEAAAILEAIENMEREQRRQEALEAAKAGIRGKKDW